LEELEIVIAGVHIANR